MRCDCAELTHTPRLIAVTGGPGAGKTAVLEIARRSLCAHVDVLPEAAGIVFGGGFPRRPTDPARRAAQRAIFHVQIELEQVLLDERRAAIGLCDRGTIDSVAYWPGPLDALWRNVDWDAEPKPLLSFSVEKDGLALDLVTMIATFGTPQDVTLQDLRIESFLPANEASEALLRGLASH